MIFAYDLSITSDMDVSRYQFVLIGMIEEMIDDILLRLDSPES